MAPSRNVLVVILIAFVAVLVVIHLNSSTLITQLNQVKKLTLAVEHEEQEVHALLQNIPPVQEIHENKGFAKPGEASPKEEFERLWNYVYTMQYNCSHGEYLGGNPGNADGAYWLCSEPRFWPRETDKEYKCLMYSFGVGGDFTFDDEIANRGCEVHSFDPTEQLEDGLVRESGVTFHKIGISATDTDKDGNGWKMRTLKTLIKELGHNGRYIDYLKMDTESYEEGLMQQVLDNDMAKCVRHYAQEIHLWGPISNPNNLAKCRHLYRAMTQLNDHGWRLYNTTDNCRWLQAPDPHARQLQVKPSMVNSGNAILWETMFVNFAATEPCRVE
uniref:methyltransferase-like protein 24 isoform X2 n=1 Tax=Ciona intestinalis TaxID=7719 RepID=UPI000180CACF|nr:methyltransferase-like protein 24 isoform X2 [Ciona intestinalis]|eukprot:XP_009858807.1 methyltransferase-like protein 24 isoform X2 [Ciona intestinalis]